MSEPKALVDERLLRAQTVMIDADAPGPVPWPVERRYGDRVIAVVVLDW
jgi:hypothetical protein